MAQIRLLSPADAPALRAFLAREADWRLMMLNNLERSGIAAGDAPYHGVYAGYFEDGDLTGCLGLFWNGMVLAHSPSGHGEMLALVRARAVRPLEGVIGPLDQIDACARALVSELGMPKNVRREKLFALPVAAMEVPECLRSGDVTVRRASRADFGQAVPWRAAMLRTIRPNHDDEQLNAQAEAEMENLLALGRAWLAERAGQAVAMATTIAMAEDRACVGGVWTPPELRGQGFARAVVAGQLMALAREGVRRSVLFTGEDNVPAQRAYRVLGFAELGPWGTALY